LRRARPGTRRAWLHRAQRALALAWRPAHFLDFGSLDGKMLIVCLRSVDCGRERLVANVFSPHFLRRKQIVAQGMTSQEQRSGRKRGRGQPTKFREEYIEHVRALCEAGVRDKEIAAYLGVSSRSLHRWQDRWPQFFQARELKHSLHCANSGSDSSMAGTGGHDGS
jgi:Homeodomain-like domain